MTRLRAPSHLATSPCCSAITRLAVRRCARACRGRTSHPSARSQTREPISATAAFRNASPAGTRLSKRSSECPINWYVHRHWVTFYHRLFHGNFVLDAAVPSKLLNMCPMRTEREFAFMRYSAATCDPNNFMEEGYTLRQVLYDPPRRTELFIVLTMYNEDEELFCRTMHGVMKNIAHLCTRERSKTWGKEGWKKVVVCIVSDGRMKINSRTLSVIATMGAYQDGIAKVHLSDASPRVSHVSSRMSSTVSPSQPISTNTLHRVSPMPLSSASHLICQQFL